MNDDDQQDDTPAVRVPPEKNRGGEWVRLGDELYRIPPLAFRSVIDLQDDVAALRTMGPVPTAKEMDIVAKIAHVAFSRNYPSKTVEDLTDMLDLGNYEAVLSAILSIAGFQKVGAGPGGAVMALPTGTPPTAH